MQRHSLAASFLLLTALLLAACTPVQPVQTQTGAGAAAAATTAPPAFVTPDAAGDWQRIRERGRLVVGTAADYPPFAYYDASFQLGGYDPALLRALGAQLGVEVLFKDFAAEGLVDALRLGQIDVAAAALAVTPQRAALIDFSRPYFAASEGVVARADHPGVVKAIADLAGQRIGVERGSIYESWLRTELVDAGLSPAENLLLYSAIDAAASDLAEGRIDAIVVDLPAAKDIAQAKGLQVVGSGLSAQQYALGIRKGAEELREQLNTALAALAANGALGQIAAQELGLERKQLTLPGELGGFAATSEPADAGCRDGLAWLEDLSLPDLGMTAPAVLAPGQSFTKRWRVLNTGTCTWDDSYQLVYAHGSTDGASMSGRPTAVRGAVAPGARYDIEVQLVAPLSAAVYQGAWQMQNAEGRSFGERLRVGVQVAAVPTPTPAPTQTPAQGIAFTADAERVLQGSPVSFTWDVQDAQEVYFYQAGQEWQNRAVAAEGSAADIPPATTTYNLRVVRSGQEEIRSLTVYVEPNPDLPQVDYFTLAPAGELTLGDCVTLAWKISGEVDEAAIFRSKEILWERAPVEGAYLDCPKTAGTYEYAVGAQGPGGRNYAVATLQVAARGAGGGADAKRTPQAEVNQGPRIEQFAVLPEQLTAGECAELRWTVAGEVSSIRIERAGTTLLDGAAHSGTGTDCPSEPRSLRYRITARDGQGRTDAAEVAVSVVAPAPSATPSPADAASAPTAEATASSAATSVPQAPGAAAAETPVGQEYVLISYRNAAGDLAAPLPGTRITAGFGGDGQLSGDGGCNAYTTAYHLNGAQLVVGPLPPAEKFCPEPLGIMDQEQQYLSALQTAAAYKLEGSVLTLLDGAGNEVAVFVTAL